MSATEYTEVDEPRWAKDALWYVAASALGQTVEVSHSWGPYSKALGPAGPGSPWMRVYDRSDRTYTYLKRTGRKD